VVDTNATLLTITLNVKSLNDFKDVTFRVENKIWPLLSIKIQTGKSEGMENDVSW
jgi:hypothetical protein